MAKKNNNSIFLGKHSKVLPYTHVLDLAEDGYIKPHVDSVRVSIFLIC